MNNLADITAHNRRQFQLFLRNAMGGWVVGNIKIARSAAEGKNAVLATLESLWARTMRATIVNYFNACYHGYYQKYDAYVIGMVDGFQDKLPVCVLTVMINLCLVWSDRLVDRFDEIDVTAPLEELNAEAARFLDRNFILFEDRLCAPCNNCPVPGYEPGARIGGVEIKERAAENKE